MTQPAAVELRGLVASYGGPPVVDHLDLTVEPGTLTALVGPSGCGKTTTLKLVAGLLHPSAGDVRFDGQSMLGLPAEKRPVAMVFQKPLLFPHLSVGDNVGFGLRMRRVSRPDRRRRVVAALELVQLADLAGRRIGELSGGQEQRVALARALVTEPRVLLLDEPFSALDASLRVEVRDLVRTLQQRLAVTTLFVTHDQEEAVALSDQVALVLDGRVEQQGDPRAFYQRPASLAAARFFGVRNELPAMVAGGRATSVLGELATTVGDGAAVVVVRPESLTLLDDGAGGTGLPAQVVQARYLGTHIAVTVALRDGTTLQATVPPGRAVPAQVRVAVADEACTVLPADGPAR